MELLTTLDAARLPGVVDLWLWEFEEPENWPSAENVVWALTLLRARPDAEDASCQQAIAKCMEYLATGG